MAEGMQKVLRQIRRNIREAGQSVMYIGGTGDGGPPFSYTVGRSERGLPELLIVAALAPDTAKAILNHLDRLMPQPLPSGTEVSLGGTYPVRLMAATHPDTWEEYCCLVDRLYGHVPVQQVVMCDKQGRFPPDCDPQWHQPLLGQPPGTLIEEDPPAIIPIKFRE